MDAIALVLRAKALIAQIQCTVLELDAVFRTDAAPAVFLISL